MRFQTTACYAVRTIFAGLFFMISSDLSFADEASSAKEVIRVTVEEVRRTVIEKRAEFSADELDEELKKIIYPVFDFEEMSRRSLGANWRRASPDQQREFIDLFSDLLARNYLKRIRDNAAESEFSLVGETARGKTSLVTTIVKYDGQQAKIDYRLSPKAGSWKVYDVVIENVGLVSNYRSEFGGIVNSEGVDGLLTRLRNKQ